MVVELSREFSNSGLAAKSLVSRLLCRAGMTDQLGSRLVSEDRAVRNDCNRSGTAGVGLLLTRWCGIRS